MPIDSGKTCLIWGANYDAGVMRMPTADLHRVDSCRAGGKYTISQVVWEDEITSLPPERRHVSLRGLSISACVELTPRK